MRPFIDPNRGCDLEGDGDCRYKFTNCYIELEYPVHSLYLVVYFIPINDCTVAVATCLEHHFDGIEQYLSDDNSVRTFTETWPLTAQLLVNGIRNQYSQGALIRFADYDTADQKWFLCTFVGNLNLDNLEGLFCERTREAELLVVNLSIQVLDEITTRQPDLVAHYGRQILSGLGQFASKLAMIGLGGLLGADGDIGDIT
jgi:hypothetical protein